MVGRLRSPIKIVHLQVAASCRLYPDKKTTSTKNQQQQQYPLNQLYRDAEAGSDSDVGHNGLLLRIF